jgi:uncharacterized repeat protein (TIGR03803 family)
MRQKQFWFVMGAILEAALLLMLPTGAGAAGTYKILHTLTRAKYPAGNLTLDAAGNLYGTTNNGGGSGCGVGCGTVWKLGRDPKGTWTVSILHVFTGRDGAIPTAGLVFDAAGNLYGTTSAGGYHQFGCGSSSGNGCGVVFKLAPNSDGTFTESVIYKFLGWGDGDGSAPLAGLIFDAVGNLYGTTWEGGSGFGCGGNGCGTVFELSPSPSGAWTESVLHRFTGADGGHANAGLIFDAAGNLFGATYDGGTDTSGTVFELKPNGDGTWTESVLYSFTGGADGGFPNTDLVFDAAGNPYGMTEFGGGSGRGVVFKLKPDSDGTWTESVLYSFTGGADGDGPLAGLVFDAAGNLYGTTQGGGSSACPGGCGVVFELTPTSTGWREAVLHSFLGYGKNPLAPVIFDPAGNLYGTASSGKANYGLIFKITP